MKKEIALALAMLSSSVFADPAIFGMEFELNRTSTIMFIF